MRSALENINSFGKQERETHSLRHSSDSMIGGGRGGGRGGRGGGGREDFRDRYVRPICGGIDSLRMDGTLSSFLDDDSAVASTVTLEITLFSLTVMSEFV